MKISIDARGITLYNGSGIGTYTENLVRELLNIDKENEYSFILDKVKIMKVIKEKIAK